MKPMGLASAAVTLRPNHSRRASVADKEPCGGVPDGAGAAAIGRVLMWLACLLAVPAAWAQGTSTLLETTASQVSAGNHTCALTAAGGVQCWGPNGEGQLGDGTLTNRFVPVSVSGLDSGVVAVSNGLLHTCAVTTSGQALCWGYNGDGELGDGTRTRRTTPVAVNGVSGVVAIATGQWHSCALTTAGKIWCWGAWYSNAADPEMVNGVPDGVIAIAAGAYFTCALTTVGGVWCWGGNADEGQLGNGSRLASRVPVAVSGLAGVVAIATGATHACAVDANGSAWCWGRNNSGQLGNGSRVGSLVPISVAGLQPDMTAIAAGDAHTCAVTRAAAVKC